MLGLTHHPIFARGEHDHDSASDQKDTADLLPLIESEYDRFLTDRSYAKARLEELHEEFTELFPDAFPWRCRFALYRALDQT